MNNSNQSPVWFNVSDQPVDQKTFLLEVALMGYNVIDFLIIFDILTDHPEMDADAILKRFFDDKGGNKTAEIFKDINSKKDE